MVIKIWTNKKIGRRTYTCVAVRKTKQRIDRELPRILIQMFDDQKYRVLKGKNAAGEDVYGIFVERIKTGIGEMVLMGKPSGRR